MTELKSLITDNIDVWTGAIKKRNATGRGSSKKTELTGVKKLRELILELAIRGKLVPQNPDDEPASELLKTIANDKAQLVENNTIKKQKPLAEVTDEEKLFHLPNSWSFTKLGTVFNSIISGGTPSKRNADFWGGDIPWASVKDLGKSKYISKTQDYITQIGLDNGSKLAEKNNILICTRMGLGKIAIVEEPVAFNQDLKAVSLSSYIDIDFFLIAYSTIKIKGTGTTVAGITQEQLLNYILALPPLEEQHRIVAKVDELMALCDHLEQQTEQSISAHQTLVQVLLDTLTASADAQEFTQNWSRIAEHFDALFTTEESIEQLKQTIFQLAVMGKLVPQDTNNESASELLKRIAIEKEQLIVDKKIKKQKTLPAVNDQEKLFELPSGWEYERIGTFGIVGTGSTPSRSNPDYWYPAEFNWVSSGETSDFFIGETKEKISALALKENNVSLYPAGTLIVAMYGQGKTRGQITELLCEAGTNQACAAIRLVNESKSHKDYVKLCFRKAYTELRSHAVGGAQPNLNVGKISNTVLAIPPLSEQHRIVTKVDELINICEQLKSQISNSQKVKINLAGALVKQGLSH